MNQHVPLQKHTPIQQVLYNHPNLVFLLSAVPLSLHRITFLILLITCVFIFLVDILEESERKIHNHCSIISVL